MHGGNAESLGDRAITQHDEPAGQRCLRPHEHATGGKHIAIFKQLAQAALLLRHDQDPRFLTRVGAHAVGKGVDAAGVRIDRLESQIERAGVGGALHL